MVTVYALNFAVILCAFFLIARNYIDLKRHDEGTQAMKERAALIRSGSETFLRQQDKVIVLVVFLMAVLLSLIQEAKAGPCFLLAWILIRLAVEIGMRAGTYGNVRTANAARVTKAISRTLRIATLGGSISGFSVPAFGGFGFLAIFAICWHYGPARVSESFLTHTPNNIMAARLMAYSLGLSMVAIFNRVAGGTFTKMNDIANDIVSKSDYGLDEDDPRNICSIGDLIGDCVNDLAGNLSDLGESYVATLMSCTVIAIQNYAHDPTMLQPVCIFPLVLMGSGLFSSLVSIMYIILKNRKRYKVTRMTAEEFFQKYPNKEDRPPFQKVDDMLVDVNEEYSLALDDPGKELNNATLASAFITIGLGLIGAKIVFGGTTVADGFVLGWISPWLASVFGIGISVCVGLLTELYTDTEHKYVKDIVRMSVEGHPFVILKGMAIGNHSVFWPSVLIMGQIIGTFILCKGFYGIGIAGVGMLSFVGTTVSIDAFGPIADNAGGIAEGCGLSEEDRAITDRLDAEGNTTAAVGKGNAISAAAASTTTTMMAFLGALPMYDLNDPFAFVKMIACAIGGMAVVSEFVSILNDNTTNGAWELSELAVKELEKPGIKEGEVLPNYNEAIKIATDISLGYMLKPALLAALSPIVIGFLFGPIGVLGLLLGGTVTAIKEAFFNGNAGGAWDNAKKSIEMGRLPGHGKGSAAHLATITGDTTGDVAKDVVAVCCDICIKIMATISTAMAVTFYMYHIF